MLMTKHGHSCIRLEKDGKVIVVDPGSFSRVSEALDGADAVLVTHEHPDHIDQSPVVEILASSGALEIFAPAGVAAQLAEAAPEAGARIHAVAAGASLEVAGFRVRTFGGQHALIHPRIPMVANVGYLIEEVLYHPGDSFIVPDGVAVKSLLVPLHAPWSKTAEVIDFVIAVRPERAFPIHDALLNDTGLAMVEKHLESIGSAYGTRYERFPDSGGVEV